MSTKKNNPPAIAPKVVAPRPDSPGRPSITPPPPPPPENGASTEVDVETVAGMERASGESKVAVARAGAVKAAKNAISAAKTAKKNAGPVRPAAPEGPRNENEDAVPAEATPSAEAAPVAAQFERTASSAPTGDSMHYSPVGGTTTVLPQERPVDSPPVTPEPVAVDATPAAASTGTPAATESAAESFAPRKVRLAVSRVNPWSVMKLAFLLSVGIGLMIVVTVIIVWAILNGMHVFAKADDFIKSVVGDASTVNIMESFVLSRVVAQSTIIAVVNVVLMTVFATILAFLYNITAALVGGLHLTLTDE